MLANSENSVVDWYFWKNWCFQNVVLEKTLESPLDCKEIKPVNCKGNHSWIFIGSSDAEAETPILWSPDVENWLLGRDPDAGKDWRQEENGTTEDEIGGWHHRLNGHEFEQAPGVGDGQVSLACCRPWGCKVSDMTEQLNWTDANSWLTGKRPWCWERWMAGGEGDDREWDGWMASPTRWTWVWASSRSWWWTGKPGMLQSMGLQKIWTWLSNKWILRYSAFFMAQLSQPYVTTEKTIALTIRTFVSRVSMSVNLCQLLNTV